MVNHVFVIRSNDVSQYDYLQIKQERTEISQDDNMTGKEAGIKGQNKPNERPFFSISFIRAICALSVVTLHTNGCFWTFSSSERYWITANIIECVFYFAVPLFFMITGITLMDYQERYSTKVYFQKRVHKVFVPYIFWSAFGAFFLLVTKRISLREISFVWFLDGLLKTDGIVNVYWFFAPLFCIYLSIPLFACIAKEKKKSTALYILSICFILNILLPFLNETFHLGFIWLDRYKIQVASGYLFWLWGGYYLFYYPPTKRQRLIIYLMSTIGLVVHIAGTHILSYQAGSIQTIFKGYNNLPCVLYSAGVFVFLQNVSFRIEKNEWMKKNIEKAGKYSFAVYLIHWYIIVIIEQYIKINPKSIIYRLGSPIIIYIIVIAIATCMKRIPGLKRMVP